MKRTGKRVRVEGDVIRAGWVREWEGDESDLGHMLFASDDGEKDDNPNWAPVYYLTPEQIEVLKSHGFRCAYND